MNVHSWGAVPRLCDGTSWAITDDKSCLLTHSKHLVSMESITHPLSSVSPGYRSVPLLSCEKDQITFGNLPVRGSIKFLISDRWDWKRKTVSHSCGNLIKSQGVDIDFCWMTLINCWSLWHLTKKYIWGEKLMSQLRTRPSFSHIFQQVDWFIFQGSKKNMTRHCDTRSFNKLNLEEVSRHSEKGELGWESWKLIPETNKCWHSQMFPMQHLDASCSTFWMEIKASFNSTLTWSECAKTSLSGRPSVDVIQGEKRDTAHSEDCQAKHSPQWPPGSKAKQRSFPGQSRSVSVATKGAKGDQHSSWITEALKGLMTTQGHASQNLINHS